MIQGHCKLCSLLGHMTVSSSVVQCLRPWRAKAPAVQLQRCEKQWFVAITTDMHTSRPTGSCCMELQGRGNRGAAGGRILCMVFFTLCMVQLCIRGRPPCRLQTSTSRAFHTCHNCSPPSTAIVWKCMVWTFMLKHFNGSMSVYVRHKYTLQQPNADYYVTKSEHKYPQHPANTVHDGTPV